ncbi:MAG: PLDc N-terminal domain-containing protein [Desulfobacterales bacterium]
MDTFTTIVIGTGIVFFLLTCCAIFDVARKDFGTMKKKALWGFIILIPFIGPVIYFLIGYKKGKVPTMANIEPK